MSSHTTVEEVAGEVAKRLSSKGIKFAIGSGRARMDVLEIVGREPVKRVVPGDSNLPMYTVYFPAHLYSIRVLEENVNKKGEWRVTDRNLKLHEWDMNWIHCGVMARYRSERGIHN